MHIAYILYGIFRKNTTKKIRQFLWFKAFFVFLRRGVYRNASLLSHLKKRQNKRYNPLQKIIRLTTKKYSPIMNTLVSNRNQKSFYRISIKVKRSAKITDLKSRLASLANLENMLNIKRINVNTDFHERCIMKANYTYIIRNIPFWRNNLSNYSIDKGGV